MKKALWFLLCLVLVVFPITALAQEEMELEEVTTEDGYFTLSVPAGWYVESEEGALYVASSEDVATRIDEAETPAEAELVEGEVGIALVILPQTVITAMSEGMAELSEEELEAAAGENPFIIFAVDATPGEQASGFAEAMIASEEGMEEAELGEAEEVELSETVVAGIAPFSVEGGEGFIISFETEEWAVLGLAVTAEGGSEAAGEIVGVVIGSLTINPAFTEAMASE